MKNILLLILTVLFAILAVAPNTFAQDYTQWNLPEGAKARLGKGSINEIQFSPDGTRLAVASSIGIWLYNTETYQEIALLTGDTGWVGSVAFSPDGRTLASGGGWADGTIRLWNAKTGAHIRTLTGHTGEVSSVAFSPDGRTLASGGGDGTNGTIRLWNAKTGAHLRTLTGDTSWVSSVSFSPDGSTIASGSAAGTVLLWELAPTPVASERLAEDINADGVVNIIDLTLVASSFGKTGQNAADVNGDGVVNIIDLTLVAAAFGNTAAAPEIWSFYLDGMPTRADVEAWLREARQTNLSDPTFQRGILILEQLLTSLTPKKTALLPNYPNPFNPETWIPYQLAKPADVSISIYAIDGKLVRTLDLGHQPIGIYTSRSHAAYWNGKNALGEPVASGFYFYTLTAGEFTATCKMLIRK